MPGGPQPKQQPGTSGSIPPTFGNGRPGGGPGKFPIPPGQPGGAEGRCQMYPAALWLVVTVVEAPVSTNVVACCAFVATQVNVKDLPEVVVSITPHGDELGTLVAV